MIQPFTSGTEFEIWQINNCFKCKKYEYKSTQRSKAGCKYAFDLDLARVSDGLIHEHTANMIGYYSKPFVCSYKNVNLQKVKINLSVFQQQRLF